MYKRPQTAGGNKGKKSVGFSLVGTKIEPPEDLSSQQIGA